MCKFTTLSLLSLLVFVPEQTLAYPASVSLTNDAALAEILADIPYLAVGLVGFAVYTFFFVMRRLNRVTTYIHVSVVLAFLAAMFDLSQIIKRGYWNTTMNLDISSEQVLIILREISHALSVAMRYIFFWAFVAEPPRGELPFVPMQDDRRPNFISLSSEAVVHSGDWARLKLIGIVLKWVLLALTLAVPVLQILWRLVNAFRTFGPIYATEAGIEIGLSAVFILKLVVNAFVSPLSPRWHTLRDYSPVVFGISVGMGVAIGNLICFKFSETTLGRFFQAVELYILILFVLVSAFYKMPVRSSVVAELVRRRLTAVGLGDIENSPNRDNRQSQISMVQAPYTMPAAGLAPPRNDGRRQEEPSRPSFTERISSSSIFSSRIMSFRGGSGQMRGNGNLAASNEEGDQSRLWDSDNPEPGPSPGGQRSFRTSLEHTPDQTPTAATKEAPGWRDPVFTSVMPQPSTGLSVSSPATKERDLNTLAPQIVVADDASQYTTDRNSTPMGLPYNRNETDSPVYGLDGIIRNYQPSDNRNEPEESDIQSNRSSGIESLLRQQAELDKSIAGLRRFSISSSNRMTLPRMTSESLQSDISLSNFPVPPTFAKSLQSDGTVSMMSTGLRVIDEDSVSIPETEVDRSKSMAISAISDNSMIVEDVAFQLVPPRMPAVMAEVSDRPQNQSIPSLSRDSLDSVLDTTNSGRAVRMGSQGTQYDVTSFIGGFSTPAALGNSPHLTDISERDRSTDSDSGSNDAATIADVTRVQVVTQGRRSEENIPDSGIGDNSSSNTMPLDVQPKVEGSQVQPQSQAQGIRPLLIAGNSKLPGMGRGRGLPTGPRGRLEISNPIRQSTDDVGEGTSFQRPRPAPLVLQNANDARPAAPEAPRDGGYF